MAVDPESEYLVSALGKCTWGSVRKSKCTTSVGGSISKQQLHALTAVAAVVARGPTEKGRQYNENEASPKKKQGSATINIQFLTQYDSPIVFC